MVETAVRRVPTVPSADWLRPLPPATRLVFYGGGAARAAASAVWAPPFSERALRANVRGGRATLWLGPDEYLLLDMDGATPPGGEPAGGRPEAALLDILESALTGIPHALVDISHRQFAIEVLGPHATTILSGACPLDLDLSAFPVGMCTRTVLAKADIVLWRTHQTTFHLEAWRSFAGYVTGVLSEIAAEFYPRH
jgi:sarcosine oxidase subunit gamma